MRTRRHPLVGRYLVARLETPKLSGRYGGIVRAVRVDMRAKPPRLVGATIQRPSQEGATLSARCRGEVVRLDQRAIERALVIYRKAATPVREFLARRMAKATP